MIYLRSANIGHFNTLDAIICSNINVPNNQGTTRFLDIKQAINDGIYFALKPTGWAGNNAENYTAEQLLIGADLSVFTEEEYNADWFPEI